MNLDELVGLLSDYPFVLIRGADRGSWVLVVNNKTFEAKDTHELLIKVEKWRADIIRAKARV